MKVGFLSIHPHTLHSHGRETVHCAQTLELPSCRAVTSAMGLACGLTNSPYLSGLIRAQAPQRHGGSVDG